MRTTRICVSAALLLGLGVMIVPPMTAQVKVQKFTKRTFAVTGFSGDAATAAQVTDVLKNDLSLSGHFVLAASAESEFLQQGTVRLEAGQNAVIECQVFRQTSRMSGGPPSGSRGPGDADVHIVKTPILSRSYRGSAKDLRRMVHRLSDDIVKEITGEPGIAQTRIAFVWTRKQGNKHTKELAVMDYDGYNVRQLTYDNSLSLRPRWSPDGRKIIYTTYVNRFPDVVSVDLYSGARKALANYPGLNSGAVYSPDGSHVALTLSKDGNPELYVMNASGGGLRRLTHTRGAESSPTWSPDGTRIAYVSDDRGSPQIYLIPRTGGKATRLTVAPSYNTEPDWSRPRPGSKHSAMLAVTSRVGGKFRIGLYDSRDNEVKLLAQDGTDNQDPSWAPNGRHLVFSKTRNWRSQLYLLDVVTGEEIQLPAINGDASEPAWGP